MQKIVLPDFGTRACFVMFGDTHIGNFGLHTQGIEAMNTYVKALKRSLKGVPLVVLGLGDFIDAITLDDKRYQPDELDTNYPQKDVARSQMRHFYQLTKPTWDAADFSIAFLGNHEEKFIQRKSFDVYDYLLTDLSGGSIIRGDYEALIRCCFKHGTARYNYDIYATHGAGSGGWREGGALNAIYDISRYYDADCFVMGHLHRLVAKTSAHLYLNQKNELADQKKHYGCAGSFLLRHTIGHRNYMEGRRGEPSVPGMLRLDVCVKDGRLDSVLQVVLL